MKNHILLRRQQRVRNQRFDELLCNPASALLGKPCGSVGDLGTRFLRQCCNPPRGQLSDYRRYAYSRHVPVEVRGFQQSFLLAPKIHFVAQQARTFSNVSGMRRGGNPYV